MLRHLGHTVARHARATLAVWTVLVLLGFGAALGLLGNESLFDRLSSGPPEVASEGRDGQELLVRTARTGQTINLLLDGVDPTDPAVKQAVDDARRDLAARADVASVVDPYLSPEAAKAGAIEPQAFVSRDGRAVLVTAALRRDLEGTAEQAAVDAVTSRLERVGVEVTASQPGSLARVGGVQALVEDITDQVEVDLRVGEGVALPISLLVMVVVFGGLLAAGLPIAGAIAAIAGALATLLAFSLVIDLDASVVNVVTVLGLGLSIDYGLLLVSRFREELRARGAPGATAEGRRDVIADALGETLATAGRTVLFSGVTVAISLAGLLVFPAAILRAIGAAGVSVVLVSLVTALTLVPALLAVSGDRLLKRGLIARLPLLRRFGDVAPEEGIFSRLARTVARRPVTVLVATLGILVLAAVPALGLRIVNSGEALLPEGAEQRVLFEQIADRFPTLGPAPIIVVAPVAAAELAPMAAQVEELDGVTSVGPVTARSGDGVEVSAFDVRVAGDTNSDVAKDVVHEIRDLDPGFRTYVTGQTAALIDFMESLVAHAAYAVLLVVLATFVLLFLMTGSVVIPIKALFMNVISLGAAFGVVAWVFQKGHLEGPLGFTSTGGIETSIPALVLAFAFGLAMDYEVFLLSRIKELHDQGLSNDEAVALGLQKSGRIITSAALIVVIVFLGFVGGQLLIIKETGIALAVAVAVDATLVRMLLVPATMTLLGDWNWWAPAPLRRLHERIGLSEG